MLLPISETTRLMRVCVCVCVSRTTVSRARVVEDWSRDGGVLLMGYEMYRLLSLKKSFVGGKKRKSKKPTGPIIIDLDEEDRQQELMKGEGGGQDSDLFEFPSCQSFIMSQSRLSLLSRDREGLVSVSG